MNDTATLEFRSGVTKVVDAAMTEHNILGLDRYGHILVSDDGPVTDLPPEVIDPLMAVTTPFPAESASHLRAAARARALRKAVETVTTDLTATTTTYYDEDHATALVVTTREGESTPYLIRIEANDCGQICAQSSAGSAWQWGWEA